MKFRKIMVATDLSEGADEALRQGHALAAKTKGELFVCHVLPNLTRANPLFPHLNQDYLAELPRFREKAGDAVAARVQEVTGRNETDFTLVVEDGVPHAGIIDAAETCKVDLLVVATRGLTGLTRVLVGSVAEQVIRYAHCSVLVTRPSPSSGRVVVATDFSDPSLPAVKAGAGWVDEFGGELTVAHAVETNPAAFAPPFPYGSVMPMPPKEEIDRVRHTAEHEIREALSLAHAKGKALVLDGFAAPAIVHGAENLDAELIVVGTAGRTGLKRVALGSVAELVVRQAHCSVLVVRLAPSE